MTKLLLIGLDGTTWTVLDRMIQGGHMPFLESLKQRSRCGVLLSTEPPITPSAWTSFMTGLPPEEHGVYGFRDFRMEDSRLTYGLNNSANIRHRSIWQVLSENGKQVCVLNLPLTYPPFEVNGYLVSGFPSPSGRDSQYTYPVSLKTEIEAQIPDYQPPGWGDGISGVDKGVRHFVEGMVGKTEQRARLSTLLMEKAPWDVFMVHFQETDFLQHRFWHFLDPSHRDYTHEGFKECAVYYSYLDEQLSRLIELARKEGYAVVALSDHGFQKCEVDLKINNWLLAKGYIHLHRSARHEVISMLKKAAAFLPSSVRAKLARGKVKTDMTRKYLESTVDYSRSAVFLETNTTNVAYAHFLRKDAATRNRFTADLLSLTLPDGSRAVQEASPVPGREDTLKVAFRDGIVASGTFALDEPWFTVPVVGQASQIGVHHREGIVMVDELLGNGNIPEEIHQVFGFILGHQGLEDTPGSTRTGTVSRSTSSQEDEQIQEALKGLGYL